MLIQQEADDHKGAFYIEKDGKRLAEMTYSMTPARLMIIDHTEVNEELKGQHIGYQLVKQAVEYARTNKIQVLPLCTFAKSVFDKKKDELGDVLRTK